MRVADENAVAHGPDYKAKCRTVQRRKATQAELLKVFVPETGFIRFLCATRAGFGSAFASRVGLPARFVSSVGFCASACQFVQTAYPDWILSKSRLRTVTLLR